MTRTCTICKHEDVSKIDALLVIEGASLRDIARQFDVGKDALARHLNNGHIADKVLEDKASANRIAGEGLASDVDWVIQEAKEIYNEERHKKNNRLAMDALTLVTKTGEVRAKIAGQIETGNKVIVNILGDDRDL